MTRTFASLEYLQRRPNLSNLGGVHVAGGSGNFPLFKRDVPDECSFVTSILYFRGEQHPAAVF